MLCHLRIEIRRVEMGREREKKTNLLPVDLCYNFKLSSSSHVLEGVDVDVELVLASFFLVYFVQENRRGEDDYDGTLSSFLSFAWSQSLHNNLCTYFRSKSYSHFIQLWY
jgi:hypothetical protein